MNFNPRSPHGERPRFHPRLVAQPAFQPTLPARGATARISSCARNPIFQPTLPARGATGDLLRLRVFFFAISTHAPRTGSDGAFRDVPRAAVEISTHAPRTGSDCISWAASPQWTQFQPTLPARGATVTSFILLMLRWMISTHAPRTGSDLETVRLPAVVKKISTHAPRTGSDPSGR